MMIKFLSTLFLGFFSIGFGQFLPYHFDGKLIYDLDNGFETSYYFNSKNVDQFAYKTNTHRKGETDPLYVKMIYNTRIIDLTVEILNEKYFSYDGHSERERSVQTGGKKYIVSDQLWEVKPYKDCKMLQVKTEDYEDTRLYFYDRKDGVDYSSVINNILQYYVLPEVSNFQDVLGKGWVLVYGEYFVDMDRRMPVMGTLRPGTSKISKDFWFSNKQMKYYLDYIPNDKPYAPDDPAPVYCSVFGANGGTDRKTFEKLGYLFTEMCSYYDFFGRYDLEDFQKYFNSEIDRKAAEYVKNKELTPKQAEKYKFEAKEYSSSNKKENLESFDN